ncbi:hypothetical protein [Mucilaginibacter sp. FT3.2]|uniref:hypothetical protein n=1 Tax=Mucilaginibacter sp. FT3.2 TaxID=2723090 RepID=UPI001618DD64|nr:hypothetical protein [Mucilaginibacter sp. FT3.2]MBB6231714.1 hypothetical protein [Mucilaginibacter sp. FT3.2]
MKKSTWEILFYPCNSNSPDYTFGIQSITVSMKSLKFILLLLIAVAACLPACNNANVSEKIDETRIIHENLDVLNQVIIYDGFTPPVASRIYAYTSLASYEALKFKNPKVLSITAQLKNFGNGPEPIKEKKYDFSLAATHAFFW